ncbi:MAG: hypothetical protein CMM01_03410 [Rhodopirellula sp.]|nr:hypothetical protein [Rhodopirellula sp.]
MKSGALNHLDDGRINIERHGQPRKWVVVLVVSFAVLLLIGACSVIGGVLLMPVFFDVSHVNRKQQVIRQMEKIGDALSAYHAAHGCYPASYTKVGDDQSGCSWRVAIASHLPGVDSSSLPKLSQNWDSPDNLKLGLVVPSVFVSPLVVAPPTRTETHVFAFMHSQSPISQPGFENEFALSGDVSFRHTHREILAVYLPNHTAHWAAPVDMTLKRLQDEVANVTPESPVVFLFTDGSVVALDKPREPFFVDEIVTGLSHSRKLN